MNSYQKEQFDAFSMAQQHLMSISSSPERKKLDSKVADYLLFRTKIDSLRNLAFLFIEPFQRAERG